MSLSYNPTVANDGLVLYLDAFNSSSYAGTGNTAFDLISGKSYALVSSPTFDSTGPKCFNLNGSTHYLSGNINQLNFGTGDFTIQTNFKLNGLSNGFTGAYNAAFVCAAAGSTGSCLIQVGGGSTSYTNIGIYHETTGILSSINYNFSTNIIYNVALARSSGVLTAYVNGTAIGSTTTTNLYDFNKGGNFIGRHYFGGYEQYFKGNVYSLQAYSRGLSSTEILQNYNATKKRFLPEENIVTNGLVLNLDPAKAISYSGVGITINDISGSGQAGTLTNGPTFSGLNGGSIVLDGTNDYILFNNAYASGFGISANATISIWAKITIKNQYTTFVGFYNPGQGNRSDFGMDVTNTNTIRLWKNDIQADTYGSVTNNNWVNYVITSDNSTAKFYRDCELLYTGNVSGSINNNRMFAISYSWDLPVNASISQTLLYNKTLTQQEIRQNYNATKSRFGLS